MVCPSSTTKAGFILGILYGVNHSYKFLSGSECVVLGAVFLVSLQCYSLWYDQVTDPFKRPQEMMWSYLSKSVQKINTDLLNAPTGNDTNTDTNAGTNTDTNTDTNTGTNTDTNTDTNTNTNADTDSVIRRRGTNVT